MGIDAEMFVRTTTPLTPREIRGLSVRIVEAFGEDWFFLSPDERFDHDWQDHEWWEDGDPIGCHALRRIRYYRQDGPDIHPNDGEQFIEVSLMGRYYGVDYERGHIHVYVAIAEWLEANIQSARVWYGGDSSDVCAKPFDHPARQALLAHFYRYGHAPYRGNFDFGRSRVAPVCGFCEIQLTPNGGGRDDVFYSCAGCNVRMVQNQPTGDTEPVARYGDDVFKAAERLRRRLAGTP